MNRKLNRSLRLSMIAVQVMWFGAVIASWVGIAEGSSTEVSLFGFRHLSTYVLLIGIALASIMVSFAQAAVDELVHTQPESVAARGVFRFVSVLVVIALVIGAVFAFGQLMSGFDSQFASIGERLLAVELPIVLDTALVIWILLRATVWRKGARESHASEKMSPERKALVLGYVLPIAGTALAIIVGLEVYNLQGRSLDVWSWTVIQLLIGVSIVLGTHFAIKARAARVAPAPARVRGSVVGAVNLNLVLSIVFGAVVTVMSISYAVSAVGELQKWGDLNLADGTTAYSMMNPSGEWWMQKMVPAYLLLLLATVGTYLSVRIRLGVNPKLDAKS